MRFSSFKGFSLIELLMVVTIIGILAAIAYPAYTDYLQRTRRSDARVALMNVATYLEHYYTENNTYASATLTGLGLTTSSPEGYYTISLSNLTATTYTATATATGVQAGDTTCPTLTVNESNTKGPSLTCWQ